MFYLYFQTAFFFLEIVLMSSTGTMVSIPGLIPVLLSSMIAGFIFNIIGGISGNRVVNRTVKSILLLVTGILFCLFYFIFCEFRIFYDLNTIFNGAFDAVGGFGTDIKLQLFSANGIIHIFLFMLPFIIYLFLMIKDKAPKNSLPKTIVAAVFCVLFISFNQMYINADEALMHKYYDEYEFDKSIRSFGLMSSICLDVKNNFLESSHNSTMEDGFIYTDNTYTSDSVSPENSVSSGNSTSTSQKEIISDNTAGDNSESDNAESDNSESIYQAEENSGAVDDGPVEYGYNVLDIDFAALALEDTGEYAAIDNYIASLTPSRKNEYTGLFEGKNLILITAEAFTAEVINEELTPTLYRMANKGIQITDYYQPASAGTTGGEFAVLMGMLPTSGGSSMTSTIDKLNYMTMGYQLNELGYYGMMYHNNDYTYYSRHRTHVNFGYSGGYMGLGNGIEEFVSLQWPESDLEMIEGTLPTYIDKQPFNIYYMTVSGHSLYSAGTNAMSYKHWESVKDLEYSHTVKAYLGCQLELEAAMTYLIDELENAGIADDTVIVISADHFPYGLDSTTDPVTMPYLSELYGQQITNSLVRDHNRLIIWSGCLEDMEPIVVDSPTFSPDITPTLLNLFGVQFDSRLMAGRDILSDAMPLMYDLGYNFKTDLGTCVNGKFTSVSDDVEIPENYVNDIRNIVKNKISFSQKVIATDYYRHLFGG